MNREDLIQHAAETLDCVGKTAHGRWIYYDQPTGWWMVADGDMERLGRLLARSISSAHAVRVWCETVPAMEVDMDLIVRDYEITVGTDIDQLITECEAAGERCIMTVLALKFCRPFVLDTVRINAEIDRDHEWDECRDGTVEEADAWYAARDSEADR